MFVFARSNGRHIKTVKIVISLGDLRSTQIERIQLNGG